MDKKKFIERYVDGLFDSRVDENGELYTEGYKFELEGIYDDLGKDIEYIKGLSVSKEEKKCYIKGLLIVYSRTFYKDSCKIANLSILNDLAMELVGQ